MEHWSKWLAYWCFACNTSEHSETKFTLLVFEKTCALPNNLKSNIEPLYDHWSYPLELKYRLQTSQKEARQNLLKNKFKRKIHYDRNTNPMVYKPNEKILIKNENRSNLTSVFSGSYVVIRDVSPNVKVLYNGKTKTIHKNGIKLYKEYK